MAIKETKPRDKFERVKSQVERLRIWRELAEKKGELVCKGDGDFIFHFESMAFNSDDGLIGKIPERELIKKNSDKVIANFAIGDDKYFFHTVLALKKDHDVLAPSRDLFLMQRRAHIRVDLEEAPGRQVNVIRHGNKTVFVDGDCLDISMGGARLVLFNDMIKVKSGDELTVVLHIRHKWTIEVSGLVRHIQASADGKQTFGFEFTHVSRGITSKLQMMILELQRMSVMLK